MCALRRRTRAFTLIELIVVLLVVGVLAAVAVPAFTFGAPQRLERASHELAMHLQMARELAVATRRTTWVEFHTSSEWYGVYIESPTSPGRANRIWVAHPVTGDSQFRVDLDDGDLADVILQSASFGGRSEVEFDRFGTPYNGLDVALTSDGTVVLLAGADTRTVRVVAETGLVEEE